jgi:rare lipoprotein A (peptidoglycan hydrolase)
VDRRSLRFAVGLTVLALPILVIDNIPRHDAEAEPVATGRRIGAQMTDALAAERERVEAAAQAQRLQIQRAIVFAAPPTTAAPPATAPPTTEAPAPTAPPTTDAPAPTAPPTAPPTTAAPAPPPPAPPPPPPPPPNTEQGAASWYRQPSRFSPNGCAHRTLAYGTTITVTHLGTGAATTCTVNDRGPYVDGRVIDLDDDVFARLAPLPAGLIPVRITW